MSEALTEDALHMLLQNAGVTGCRNWNETTQRLRNIQNGLLLLDGDEPVHCNQGMVVYRIGW